MTMSSAALRTRPTKPAPMAMPPCSSSHSAGLSDEPAPERRLDSRSSKSPFITWPARPTAASLRLACALTLRPALALAVGGASALREVGRRGAGR